MTRKEKIDAIVGTIIDSINTHRAVQNWMEEVLVYGRVGLDSMTNEEIDEEYELWCDGGIEEPSAEEILIEAMNQAHEAETNKE